MEWSTTAPRAGEGHGGVWRRPDKPVSAPISSAKEFCPRKCVLSSEMPEVRQAVGMYPQEYCVHPSSAME